jgi:hypothetical protein
MKWPPKRQGAPPDAPSPTKPQAQQDNTDLRQIQVLLMVQAQLLVQVADQLGEIRVLLGRLNRGGNVIDVERERWLR